MKKLAFFKCENCGNVIVKLVESGVNLYCCGREMVELNANSTEASQEKHIPVVKVEGNIVKVSVGSVLHPMSDEHFINFVVLETSNGYKIANLTPQSTPEVTFALNGNEKPINVYEYCNLHGLWVYNIK